jgi:hypothetical protein
VVVTYRLNPWLSSDDSDNNVPILKVRLEKTYMGYLLMSFLITKPKDSSMMGKKYEKAS